MHAVHDSTRGPSTALPVFRSAVLAAAVFAAGCAGTSPTLGGGQGGTVVTGSAGGATSTGANPQLETCAEPLGTVALDEDVNAPWYHSLQQYRLGSTTPLLRLMIQQSNCFVVVERGRSMNNVMRERDLARSGEARAGSNFGGGQMVVADYTMQPSVQFSARGMEGLRLGGFGAVGTVLSTVSGSLRSNEAATTLLLVDNRSSVQLAAAQGSARNFDLGGTLGLFTGGLGGSAGAYSSTPEGKIVAAAFLDSYNQTVKAVRNYRAQTIRGGLGTGGALGVDGGSTPASRQLDVQPAAPAAVPVPSNPVAPTGTTPPRPSTSGAPANRSSGGTTAR